jgi:transposase InsO family protein
MTWRVSWSRSASPRSDRFGTLRPDGVTRVIPQRQRPRLPRPSVPGRVSGLPLRQEFITPYAPQQNGMIERFLLEGVAVAVVPAAGREPTRSARRHRRRYGFVKEPIVMV